MTSSANKTQPPALLTDGNWYGSLAAARELGAHGVPITLASVDRLAPACWSRHVDSVVVPPPTGDKDNFLRWLLEFGERRPGHVLYPTSDNTAWLYATEKDALSDAFHLRTPTPRSLAALLDKAQLADNARAAGMEAPVTTVPKSPEEVLSVARELGLPVFVKPRVKLFGTGSAKGQVVATERELVPAWAKLHELADYESETELTSVVPDVEYPVMQPCADDTERVYTINGFVDPELGLFNSIGCIKLLQHPRGKGPGLIFEEREVAPEVNAALKKLFENTEYFGVYDAEFVERDGVWQMIDVNPRFYNHMSFEIERGMALAWWGYLSSSGRIDELVESVKQYNPRPQGPKVYVHDFPIRLLLFGQAVSRRMSSEELKSWYAYLNPNGSTATNPVKTLDDVRPVVAEIAYTARNMLRHPRSAWRALTYSPR